MGPYICALKTEISVEFSSEKRPEAEIFACGGAQKTTPAHHLRTFRPLHLQEKNRSPGRAQKIFFAAVTGVLMLGYIFADSAS